MNRFTLSHFGTLTLMALMSASVWAQELKPQVVKVASSVEVTAPPRQLTPAETQGPLPGQPIVVPVTPVSPQQQEQDKQESQALMNAFQQVMNALMGGGRSEFADSGHSGHHGADGHGGGGGSTPVSPNDLNGPYRINPPFRKYFNECTKKYGDCKFENWGIMGDAAHRARRSCHNAGEAIDVGPITCSSARKFDAKSEEFYQIAKCMAHNSNNELEVIFYKGEGRNMKRQSDHSGHMHIQLKNCNMIFGR